MADESPAYNTFKAGLGDALLDLVSLEINTVECTCITAERYPGGAVALGQVLTAYARSLGAASTAASRSQQDLLAAFHALVEAVTAIEEADPTQASAVRTLEEAVASLGAAVQALGAAVSAHVAANKALRSANEALAALRDAQMVADKAPEAARKAHLAALEALEAAAHLVGNPSAVAQRVLANASFLRGLVTTAPAAWPHRARATLRKLWEVGADRIVAQSVITMDGDMTLRVDPSLVGDRAKAPLLEAHQQQVSAAMGWWGSLVKVLVDLVRGAVR